MKPRTALAVVSGLALLMIVQAFVLTFWCESASVFAFHVEDLTFQPKRVFPILEFKSTLPGMVVFGAVFGLALNVRRGRTVSLLGQVFGPGQQLAALVALTGWNLLFAAFLVVLEFRYLTPCPV